jgi:signal transduction histidine kinase
MRKYLSSDQSEYSNCQGEPLLFENNVPTEFVGIKKDGTLIYIQIHSSTINYDGSMAKLAIIRDITEKKLEERNMNTASILAEEKERGRLAKELHDGLGPLLSTAKIYIYNIQNREPGENIDSFIEKLEHITEDAITSVKEISNNISPHVLRNFGLVKAVRSFISKLTICNKIQTDFYEDEQKRFPEVYEITIYRTVAELLNNTIKYAQAQKIHISMKEENNKFQFWYSDDGKGFDFEETIQRRMGLGLFNILSRVNSLGGYIKFNSNPGNGMNVYIEFIC